MGTPQWPKGIGMLNNEAMESARPPPPPLPPTTNNKGRAQKEQCLNCPRCNSTNTKFCYYNNYSLTQPRHYCKTCRRYWTRGGSLRNVPIGGTSRKNKRPAPTPPPSASISPSPSSSNKKLFTGHRNPNLTTTVTSIHAAQDLNLAYPSTQNYNDAAINSRTTGLLVPCTQNFDTATINPRTSVFAPSAQHYSIATLSHGYHHNTNPTTPTGFASMGLNSFLPVLNSGAGIYSSGFGGFQEYKPLKFSLDGFDGSIGHGTQPQENGTTGASCKPLFPFEDLKQQVSSTAYGGDSNAVGYWNNMLGGGPW